MKAQVVTGDTNHATVQNLRGWSVAGSSPVLNLRKKVVTGDIIAVVHDAGSFILPTSLDADEGCYVEVVSGTITSAVLWYT